jgi:hypothetical protein
VTNRLLVVAVAIWCWCSRAQRCPAPPGWYVNGARPDGSYELAPILGRPEDDLVDAWLRRELEGPAPVPGRLHCTGGATMRQDGTSVWCQR